MSSVKTETNEEETPKAESKVEKWDPMADEDSDVEWNPMEDIEVEEIVDADDIYNFYDGVAQDLSATKIANASDFECALDYSFYDGNYQGSIIKDSLKARRITGDMQPLLNGGWKAYMFSADNDYYDRDWERYLIYWISGEKNHIALMRVKES